MHNELYCAYWLKKIMTTRKGGPPKGKANNPKGINQYGSGKNAGDKNAQLTVRLSFADKQKLKEAARKKGMTLSSWLLEIALEAANA